MTTYGVTGATGNLGGHVVETLLDRGAPPSAVVAVVRDAAKAQPLAERGVQVRVADYDDPERLRTALAGVDRLLLVSGTVPGERVAQHRNVVDAARAAGVGRVAYTSIAHADTNTMPLGADHRATEEHLRASGVPSVFLRNSWYLETYTDQVPTYLQVGAILGAAGEARISAAPRSDYAEAAAAALLDDDTDSAVYELGGQPFTMPELAQALSDVLRRDLPYRDLPLQEFRAALLGAGLDEGTADFVTSLERGTARGELDVDPTDLERLLGRPATDLRSALARLVG